MQKGRQTFPKAIISRGGLVKQALLHLAGQISPNRTTARASSPYDRLRLDALNTLPSEMFEPSTSTTALDASHGTQPIGRGSYSCHKHVCERCRKRWTESSRLHWTRRDS
jgi:hypothetical protein